MHTQITEDKLKALRLSAMSRAWKQQSQVPDIKDLGFDERFSMLVDAELLARENHRIQRMLRDAKLRFQNASVENLKTGTHRGIETAWVAQLNTCRWIEEHLNILLTGPTGVGKTYLACALGQMACRRGFRTLYLRMPRLVEEIRIAHADGTYIKLLARLGRVKLLILDDWGMAPMTDIVRQAMLEIAEDRCDKASLIVTSQLPISQWQ